MELSWLGKWLLVIGIGLAGLGGILWVAGRMGLPLGQLPGDVRVRGEDWSFSFPIATCLVVSVVLTVVLSVLLRILR
jgi:hypothetical protein